jgi:hypothetical protein
LHGRPLGKSHAAATFPMFMGFYRLIHPDRYESDHCALFVGTEKE